MLYLLLWSMIGLLFACWTAVVWVLHAAAQWFAGLAPAQLEAATMAAGDTARQAIPLLGLPDGLASGLPAGIAEAWLALAQSLLPWLQSLQQQVPALVGWLSPAIWIGWGVGALLLLLAGIALQILIRIFAGRRLPPATPLKP